MFNCSFIKNKTFKGQNYPFRVPDPKITKGKMFLEFDFMWDSTFKKKFLTKFFFGPEFFSTQKILVKIFSRFFKLGSRLPPHFRG